MTKILITGSAQGLGRAAAADLLDEGHEVVVHARDADRAQALAELTRRGAHVVVGDLADLDQTQGLAHQVEDLGGVDVVIHNAGIYGEPRRSPTPDGHPRTLAVNVLAPYLMTCLMPAVDRLIFLTSDMHTSGSSDLSDLDWTARRWDATQAYCDSKLLITAFALGLARRWPHVVTSAVDPGWVPTRMGGPSAPGDLAEGHRTQVWLATSQEDQALVSGQVWHHGQHTRQAPAAGDPSFQDQLLERLEWLTGQALPAVAAR